MFDSGFGALYDRRPMNRCRRQRLIPVWFAAVLVAVGGASCKSRNKTPPAFPVARVASLVPAATEIMLEIGGKGVLVAVSNYDSSPEVAGLPRVGDYQRTEWETLARVEPGAMIIQIAPDRVSPALQRQADELGIRLVNVKIDRLADVYAAIDQLGEVIGKAAQAKAIKETLQNRLEGIGQRTSGRPARRTLVVRDIDGQDVIGPGNYLDDLLGVVHATNAAGGLGNPYPTIDRETIARLSPEVVIVLLPEADAAGVERARRCWAGRGELEAVKSGRVTIITDRDTLLPGPRMGDLAEKFARAVHGPDVIR